jgi:hypothetical protein
MGFKYRLSFTIKLTGLRTKELTSSGLENQIIELPSRKRSSTVVALRVILRNVAGLLINAAHLISPYEAISTSEKKLKDPHSDAVISSVLVANSLPIYR